jgi:hypothetical protein
MPGGAPPGGALPQAMPQAMPPGLGAPAAHIGPVATPQANPGNAQSGVVAIHNAVDILQKALPSLQMGSPLHGAAMKAVTELTKAIGETTASAAQKVQEMIAHIRSQGQNPMQAAMQRAMPPTAPNMPPPGGAQPPGA